MTTIEKALRSRLQSLRDVATENPAFASKLTWDTNLVTYVLEHGKDLTPRPRPKGVRKGKPKDCYANAERLAIKTGYPYCEGFCLVETVDFEHAWCLDPDGFVVDPTLDPGGEYFGLQIDLQQSWELRAHAHQRGLVGVPALCLLANP